MKTLISALGMSIIFLLFSVNVNAGNEKVPVNTKNSKLDWNAKKVTGEHSGTLRLSSGTLITDGKQVTGGSFSFDMTTINTTDLQGEWKDKLDGHLKSDDFFSVEKHPSAQFKITSVKQEKGTSYSITGDLTIKGITKPVTFKSTIVVDGKNIEASGIATVDRTKYDVKYGSGQFFEGLGDKMIYDDFTLKFTVTTKE